MMTKLETVALAIVLGIIIMASGCLSIDEQDTTNDTQKQKIWKTVGSQDTWSDARAGRSSTALYSHEIDEGTIYIAGNDMSTAMVFVPRREA